MTHTKSTRLRRNDVVLVPSIRDGVPDYSGFRMYGRVWRRVSPDEVEVIDCGKYVQVFRDEWLEKSDYKGSFFFHRPELFNRMPTLRRLKQITAFYNPQVWRKKRDTRRARLADIIAAERAEEARLGALQ